jgi:hypothetical protein
LVFLLLLGDWGLLLHVDIFGCCSSRGVYRLGQGYRKGCLDANKKN